MRELFPHKRAQFEKEFLEPAKKFTMFSPDDIQVFAQVFREFDFDGSGTLDVQELGAALNFMGQGFTEEQLKQIIDTVDQNKTGVVTWVGFLEVTSGCFIIDCFRSQSPSMTESSPALGNLQHLLNHSNNNHKHSKCNNHQCSKPRQMA